MMSIFSVTTLTPAISARTSFQGLHEVLANLYQEMMPLCSELILIAQGMAGFAALFYIGSRIWKHLSQAEPVDIYPLFRPFVLGFCIAIFPSVLSLINAVMQPTASATAGMVQGSNQAIEVLLQQREAALRNTRDWDLYMGMDGSGNRDAWHDHTFGGDASEGWVEAIGNDIRFAMERAGFRFRHSIKAWMSEILQLLFEAASLCINTLRTFHLLVLSILGPLVFGLAVFDGFQHTLTVWMARYINVYLWLPVAHIFGGIIGKIQEQMLRMDLSQLQQDGETFFTSTDAAYLIFLILGIAGYFSVPSVANYIVHAGGSQGLLQRSSQVLFAPVQSAYHAGISTYRSFSQHSAKSGSGMQQDLYGDQRGNFSQDMASRGSDSGYFQDRLKGP